MGDVARRPKGWHVHPDDPTSVRYWDGVTWARERDRPVWSVSAGELLVDVDGHLPLTSWSDPAIEGPARPGGEAAAAATPGNRGALRRPKRRATSLRSSQPPHGPQFGYLPPRGGHNRVGSGQRGSRRSMAIFGFLLATAIVLGMVALLGWNRSASLDVLPLPSTFVTDANHACLTTLGSSRPTELPATPAGIAAQDRQLAGLTSRLGSLAAAHHAAPLTAGWLLSLHEYVAVQQQRATSTSEALAVQARSAEVRADNFAAVSGLQSCSILDRGPAGAQSIPS